MTKQGLFPGSSTVKLGSMYKAGSQIDVLKKVHAPCSSVEGCGKRRWRVSQLVTRQGLALHIYALPDCLALQCNS